MKRYIHWPVYVLLLLLPLQSIAAANMLVCNRLQQVNHTMDAAKATMPCHDSVEDDSSSVPSQQQVNNDCKMICSSLLTASAVPYALTISVITNTVPRLMSSEDTYLSVTLPRFQRPPIFAS
jgi:hypothetical protein